MKWCEVTASCPRCKEPIEWLFDQHGVTHMVQPPKAQPVRGFDALSMLGNSLGDSLDDFIVPDDGSDSDPNADWSGGGTHLNLRKRTLTSTRASKRTRRSLTTN